MNTSTTACLIKKTFTFTSKSSKLTMKIIKQTVVVWWGDRDAPWGEGTGSTPIWTKGLLTHHHTNQTPVPTEAWHVLLKQIQHQVIFRVSTCLVVYFLLHVVMLDGNRWLPLTTGHRSAPLKADDLAGYLSESMEQMAQSQQYCVKNNSIVNSFAMIYFRSVWRRWIYWTPRGTWTRSGRMEGGFCVAFT